MAEDTKKCPFCAETIKAEAIVCRYCGHDLPPLSDSLQPTFATVDDLSTRSQKQVGLPTKKKRGMKSGFILIGIFLLCICSGLTIILNMETEQQDQKETAKQGVSSIDVSTATSPPALEVEVTLSLVSPTSTPEPEPTATPIPPTSTPEPINTPISSFADIVQGPIEKGWTETQYSTYLKSIEGQRVQGWSGTILEIEESLGRPYLSLDMEPGEPKIDTYAYINESDVIKVGLGQKIAFDGTIEGDWREGNGLYALQIKDVILLELGEIPTPTPVPPTPTPGPTGTPTPDIGTSGMAEVMCEDFVEDRLKSPSSADFGGWLEDWDEAVFIDAESAGDLGLDTTTLRNSGVWVVKGQVDAQNAFGAMIRSQYICIMDYDKNTQMWYLLDISIE